MHLFLYWLQIWAFACAFAFAGCSVFKKSHDPKEVVAPVATIQEHLKAKRDLYIEAQPHEAMDGVGWPLESKCDGLLFCSLDAVGGAACNPMLAEAGDGHWLRHPDASCYPCGPGKKCSENSKDQFVGLMPYLYRANQLGAVERLAVYGQANDWYMGEASDESTKISNELFLPPLRATLFEMQARLGGPDNAQRKIPHAWLPEATGFERHLQVIHKAFRGVMQGGINDLELDYLKACAEKEPHNALYVAAYHRFKDGDQTAAAALLDDETRFPNDHLPTSANFCTDYLYQRDEIVAKLALTPNTDWLPCPAESKTHAGIDFIFTMWVMGL